MYRGSKKVFKTNNEDYLEVLEIQKGQAKTGNSVGPQKNKKNYLA